MTQYGSRRCLGRSLITREDMHICAAYAAGPDSNENFTLGRSQHRPFFNSQVILPVKNSCFHNLYHPSRRMEVISCGAS